MFYCVLTRNSIENPEEFSMYFLSKKQLQPLLALLSQCFKGAFNMQVELGVIVFINYHSDTPSMSECDD